MLTIVQPFRGRCASCLTTKALNMPARSNRTSVPSHKFAIIDSQQIRVAVPRMEANSGGVSNGRPAPDIER